MAHTSLLTLPTHSNQNKQRHLVFVASMALLATLTGCGEGNQGNAKGPGKMSEMPPMPVTVIEAKNEHVPILIEAVGQTEGSKDIEVRARVSGILTQQLYKEGDHVRAGATLFTIDRAQYEIALAQAQAAVVQDKASLEKAQREVSRLKPLVDEKAISSRELDDANTALQTSQAALKVSEARLRDAELNLSYTNVTAPISGMTDRAQFSQGTLVAPGTASSLLTMMHSIDPIWVRFSFSETEAMQLRNGGNKRKVQLVLPDGSTYDVTGKINFSASTIDSRTGTVQMRAEFPNDDHLLLPGQFVRVQVSIGEREAYLIPQAALAQTEQGSMLFTVTPENTVAPRPVETEGWSGQNWVVTKGLAQGDKVIIDNLMKLRPGAAVIPHAPGEMPAPPAGTKQ